MICSRSLKTIIVLDLWRRSLFQILEDGHCSRDGHSSRSLKTVMFQILENDHCSRSLMTTLSGISSSTSRCSLSSSLSLFSCHLVCCCTLAKKERGKRRKGLYIWRWKGGGSCQDWCTKRGTEDVQTWCDEMLGRRVRCSIVVCVCLCLVLAQLMSTACQH